MADRQKIEAEARECLTTYHGSPTLAVRVADLISRLVDGAVTEERRATGAGGSEGVEEAMSAPTPCRELLDSFHSADGLGNRQIGCVTCALLEQEAELTRLREEIAKGTRHEADAWLQLEAARERSYGWLEQCKKERLALVAAHERERVLREMIEKFATDLDGSSARFLAMELRNRLAACAPRPR